MQMHHVAMQSFEQSIPILGLYGMQLTAFLL